MPRTLSPFPELQDWQSMSEAEQDALIGRIEGKRRRGQHVRRLFRGLAFGVAGTGLLVAAYFLIAIAH
jgi:hypothetical protein